MWWALLAIVVVGHAVFMAELADSVMGRGSAAALPERLQVAFVRELQMRPSAPAVVPRSAVLKRTAPVVAAAPFPAASQAAHIHEPIARRADTGDAGAGSAGNQAAPEPAPDPTATLPLVTPPGVVTDDASVAKTPPAEPAATAVAEQAGAAGSPPSAFSDVAEPPFEWPPSTRLSYALTGWYRGDVYGSAQVEWVRVESRYQVHLDVVIGPSFAPLVTRSMNSEGELTTEGLRPQRYDERTKTPLREPRGATIRFEPQAVVMPDGRTRDRWPGLQDAVSQFVQLTWLFTTQPQLLRAGTRIELPLALPRHIDTWVYDVIGEETLYAPFGAVNTVHLKPRRTARPGGDLTAEIWFAPRLQYLPVRIRIRQDSETFIDLMIERPPLQAQR